MEWEVSGTVEEKILKQGVDGNLQKIIREIIDQSETKRR